MFFAVLICAVKAQSTNAALVEKTVPRLWLQPWHSFFRHLYPVPMRQYIRRPTQSIETVVLADIALLRLLRLSLDFIPVH